MRAGGIIVTGASSGIGAATAIELARRGCTVACLSRRGEPPPDAPADLGERLVPFGCDITDDAGLARTFAQAARDMGGVAALVNNAGKHLLLPSADMDPSVLRDMLETNVVGTFQACRAIYPYLRDTGGLIINISSFHDHLGVRTSLAYAASKAAVSSMTRTLAVEWAQNGIAVLAVAPGYVLTNLNRHLFADERVRNAIERRIPVRRLGEPQEIARLVAALVQEAIPFLTGETIYIDGGEGITI